MNAREAELNGTMDFTRQRDWYDPTKSDASVTLVGCGGIGTPTALALAKLGIPNLTLIDPDIVEAHNVPNQLFPRVSVGAGKVAALAGVLDDFAISNVRTYQTKVLADGFEGEQPGPFRGIVVSALDSMSARADLWKQLRYNIGVELLVDARLGGEKVVVYTVDPRVPAECERYEQSLYSDEDALPDPCTRRSVIDVGFVVASLIVRVVRRHLAAEPIEPMLFWNHARLSASVG